MLLVIQPLHETQCYRVAHWDICIIFCGIKRLSKFAMIAHSTPVLLFAPTASRKSVTSLFCKARGSKESIRKSLCLKTNVVDGVSQIELVLNWNQFSVLIPCHCMCFLGCRAELNIVFSEVMTEVAREWAISLPSYLWQSRMSYQGVQINKI